jgi:GNAT superfamily N-acetyltransferase
MDRSRRDSTLAPEITVRRLDPSEWSEYRDLRLRALQDSPDAFATTYADARARPDAEWRRRLANIEPTRDLPLVAETASGFVGMAWAVADREGDAAHLYQMWVAPELRGGGVGRRLLDAAVEWARSRRVRRIILGVTCGNSAARRLYESAGFAADGAPEPLRPSSTLTVQSMALVIQDSD